MHILVFQSFNLQNFLPQILTETNLQKLFLQTNFPGLGILDDKLLVALVLLLVFGAGVLITWIGTYFATQRFLNLRTDDLY
jgi:cell division protein FtsX